MVRNLAVLALLLIGLLAGMITYDYMRIPSRNLVIFYTSNLRGRSASPALPLSQFSLFS